MARLTGKQLDRAVRGATAALWAMKHEWATGDISEESVREHFIEFRDALSERDVDMIASGLLSVELEYDEGKPVGIRYLVEVGHEWLHN